ncbi:MAG: RND family transporter [Deltaproteobacteria bacterium]|nr:MAG: RND family transporter [Deltaproteobacteria bacterium]
MDKKIASAIFRYRKPILLLMSVLTVLFAWRAAHLKLSYDFEKLLPRNHPYVKTYQEFQETFGGANLITIEVAVKQGDIFNYETLNKIRKITDDIQFIPGVDRYKVVSIGAKKIKDTKSTSWGIEKNPLLWPDVPKTPEAIQALRRTCMSDDTIFGVLVSIDGKAAMIMADVYEKGVNYQKIYAEIRKVLDREGDANTTIHVSGEPIVVGEVIKAMPKILWIFGISMLLVLGILYLHFMNLRIPVLHITVSGATTIWGLGLMEILHFTLNPMTTIVPFLLMVISISHANQMITRYAEKSILRGQGGIDTAEEALGEILVPGVAALGTNLAGFAVLAIIPIGTIQELAITASVGMVCAVIRDLTVLPLLLSYIPDLGKNHEKKHVVGGLFEKMLTRISHSIFNRTERVVVLGTMTVLFGLGAYYASHLDIGSLHPGSPLFWENSRYNRDTKKINEDFYGTDVMSVVIKGEPGVLREPEILHVMGNYQRFISGVPKVGGAISLVDMVKGVNQKVHEDDPVWFTIPSTAKEVGAAYYLFYSGADPGDFDIFGTNDLDSANIRVFFKDHTVGTINKALEETKRFFAENPLKAGQVRLAGGLIGVLGAIGEVLGRYHLEATLLSYGLICAVTLVTFRSFIAMILVCVPLGMVSVMSFAFMKLFDIELDVNTLPIAALGMGLCVDYGIYLYGKIQSESRLGGTFKEVLDRAMVSCGSAVIVTGTTFTVGVILWVFSDLRFQATMGILLAFMFVMNMVTSILVLPILIDVVKPKDIFSYLDGPSAEPSPEEAACRVAVK